MGWYFRTFSRGFSAVSIEGMNDVQVALQELRERGWTLVGVADELGVFRTAVDKWVAGLRYPRNAKAVLALLATLRRRRTRPLRPLVAIVPEAEPSRLSPSCRRNPSFAASSRSSSDCSTRTGPASGRQGGPTTS